MMWVNEMERQSGILNSLGRLEHTFHSNIIAIDPDNSPRE